MDYEPIALSEYGIECIYEKPYPYGEYTSVTIPYESEKKENDPRPSLRPEQGLA
jgi:hypothetical protein